MTLLSALLGFANLAAGIAGAVSLVARFRGRALVWILSPLALVVVFTFLGKAEARFSGSDGWFPGLGWQILSGLIVLPLPFVLCVLALKYERRANPPGPIPARILGIALATTLLVCAGGGVAGALEAAR